MPGPLCSHVGIVTVGKCGSSLTAGIAKGRHTVVLPALSKYLNILSTFPCHKKAYFVIFAHGKPNMVKNLINLNNMLSKLQSRLCHTAVLSALLSLSPSVSRAGSWDTYPDTWVAADGLGREIFSADTRNIKADKPNAQGHTVGIFYYLWHGSHLVDTSGKAYDVTEILKKSTENPEWGPFHEMHWWGKPVLDYYKAGDSYVIEKHLQMICDAGIDFLFFDVTNAFTYPEAVKQVMKEIDRRENLGMKAPKLCFMVHSYTQNTVRDLYNNFYSHPEFDKYWYNYKGKPLMLGNKTEVGDATLLNRFTWRNSWAWMNGSKPDEWSWLENYPQMPGWSGRRTNYEQMSVSTAQHAHSKIGKSYHDGQQPPLLANGTTPYTGQGLYYNEQWKRAHAMNAQHVMITQFNEWQAMRFIADGRDGMVVDYVRPCGKKIPSESVFIDAYNAEFNRDIEPSVDPILRDNYLMQTVNHVRRYKGVRQIPIPSTERHITLDGNMEQWTSIAPEYRDDRGDVLHRDYTDYTGHRRIQNATGRNDFELAKVAKDAENICFYVQTTGNITPFDGNDTQWMRLFINTDTCYHTGWEGYDFMVSADKTTHKYSLFRHAGSGFTWQNIGEIVPFVDGRKMYFAINRSLLGLANGKECDIDFKWTDNVPAVPDLLNFYTDGDVAPNGRFNYRYKGSLIHTTPTGIASANAGETAVTACRDGNNQLLISILSAGEGTATVDVFGAGGELMSRKTVHLNIGNNSVVTGCTPAPAIVRVVQNGRTYTCKTL